MRPCVRSGFVFAAAAAAVAGESWVVDEAAYEAELVAACTAGVPLPLAGDVPATASGRAAAGPAVAGPGRRIRTTGTWLNLLLCRCSLLACPLPPDALAARRWPPAAGRPPAARRRLDRVRILHNCRVCKSNELCYAILC